MTGPIIVNLPQTDRCEDWIKALSWQWPEITTIDGLLRLIGRGRLADVVEVVRWLDKPAAMPMPPSLRAETETWLTARGAGGSIPRRWARGPQAIPRPRTAATRSLPAEWLDALKARLVVDVGGQPAPRTAYVETQPRDERGRWTSGASTFDGGGKAAVPTMVEVPEPEPGMMGYRGPTQFVYGDLSWQAETRAAADAWDGGGVYEAWSHYGEQYDMRLASAALMGEPPPPAYGDELGAAEVHDIIESGSAGSAANWAVEQAQEKVEAAYLALQSVADSPTTDGRLWRGLNNVDRSSPILDVQPGEKVVWPLTATSPDRGLAEQFAEAGYRAQNVLIEILPGAHAKAAPSGYETEIEQSPGSWTQVPIEFVTQGQFTVVSNEPLGSSGRLITVRQDGVYDPATGGMRVPRSAATSAHGSLGRGVRRAYSENQPRDERGRWSDAPSTFDGGGEPADDRPTFAGSTWEPVAVLADGKAAYMAERGLESHGIDFATVTVDPQMQRDLAAAYNAMPMSDPEAFAAYDQLAVQVDEQYRYLTETLGVKVEFTDQDPYVDGESMRRDLEENGRLMVLRTSATGSHAYLTDWQNDQFRAVHDAFGHAAIGRGFDRNGEEAAYQSHAEMFQGDAVRALASETRGQNAVLITEGDFPPQKVGLLPLGMEAPTLNRMAEPALAAAPVEPVDADADNLYDLTGVHHVSLGRRLGRTPDDDVTDAAHRLATAAMRAATARRAFSEQQPRDDRGRWTDGAPGGIPGGRQDDSALAVDLREEAYNVTGQRPRAGRDAPRPPEAPREAGPIMRLRSPVARAAQEMGALDGFKVIHEAALGYDEAGSVADALDRDVSEAQVSRASNEVRAASQDALVRDGYPDEFIVYRQQRDESSGRGPEGGVVSVSTRRLDTFKGAQEFAVRRDDVLTYGEALQRGTFAESELQVDAKALRPLPKGGGA